MLGANFSKRTWKSLWKGAHFSACKGLERLAETSHWESRSLSVLEFELASIFGSGSLIFSESVDIWILYGTVLQYSASSVSWTRNVYCRELMPPKKVGKFSLFSVRYFGKGELEEDFNPNSETRGEVWNFIQHGSTTVSNLIYLLYKCILCCNICVFYVGCHGVCLPYPVALVAHSKNCDTTGLSGYSGPIQGIFFHWTFHVRKGKKVA